MPYLGVKPADEFTSKDLNGEELILDADADTTITADTDDQIDIKIAGADDFQFTANKFLVQTGSVIDVNGTELILDADADTSITADTDDQIDIKIAGADDFQFTANTFTAAASSVVALDDGAVATPALTNTGDLNTGIYFPAADTVGITAGGTEQFRFGSNPIPGGSKNLFINGGMTIAQRTSQTIAASGRAPTDMWSAMLDNTAGRITLTQDSTTGAAVPLGHGYALKADCTTAEGSLDAADVLTIRNSIEAQNLQHLRWGEASAKAVTLSFWMSSPKSGTHCVTLNQPDSSYRHYISEFTVASADTWEHFKITIPGDTGGTINNDTGAGLQINFPLICGSTYQNTKDTWAAGEDYGSSSVQNLLDNTSNNVYITGVQLEVGSVATDFAHEDIGTTLQKCYRYYQRRFPWTEESGHIGQAYAAGSATWVANYLATMRATPTVTNGSSLMRAWNAGRGGLGSFTAISVYNNSTNTCAFLGTGASGLAAGNATHVIAIDNGSIVEYSAEL